VTTADTRAAALQYVRKVAGMHKPSTRNAAAFEEAVTAIAEATDHLLEHLVMGSAASRT